MLARAAGRAADGSFRLAGEQGEDGMKGVRILEDAGVVGCQLTSAGSCSVDGCLDGLHRAFLLWPVLLLSK